MTLAAICLFVNKEIRKNVRKLVVHVLGHFFEETVIFLNAALKVSLIPHAFKESVAFTLQESNH